MSDWKLRVFEPESKERRIPLKESLTIGRDPQCGCVLSDPRVSSRHAQILADDRKLGEWVQRGFQVKARLLTLVEQANGPLPIVAGDMHLRHQRLDHLDLRLGHAAVGLGEVAKRGEQGIEK